MWHRRLTLLLTLLLSTLAHAQEEPAPDTAEAPRAEDLRDIMSARGYGMGGAWRALGVGAESGTGNPAAVAAFRTYRIELTGGWDWVGKDAAGMVAVADATTSALAAGVSYQLISLGKGTQRATAHLNTVALALPLADSLMIGVSSRYLLMRGARQANAITGDAGILIRPSGFLSLGVSAHNLIGTGNPELTRYYSAHAGIFAGLLTVAADVRADFETNNRTTFTYSGGMEFILGQLVPVRAGYTWDGFTRSSQLGLGIGVLTGGGGLDLAYHQDFGGEKGRLIALTFKVQVR
jgi:opacity protein-like surface antigen